MDKFKKILYDFVLFFRNNPPFYNSHVKLGPKRGLQVKRLEKILPLFWFLTAAAASIFCNDKWRIVD